MSSGTHPLQHFSPTDHICSPGRNNRKARIGSRNITNRWFASLLLVQQKIILQGKVKRKRKKETERRRGGKTISKSGQEMTLPAQ